MNWELTYIAIVLWVIVAVMAAGAVGEDGDAEPRHFIMAAFWPITLAIFFIVGPVVAAFATFRACLGMFKS